MHPWTILSKNTLHFKDSKKVQVSAEHIGVKMCQKMEAGPRLDTKTVEFILPVHYNALSQLFLVNLCDSDALESLIIYIRSHGKCLS